MKKKSARQFFSNRKTVTTAAEHPHQTTSIRQPTIRQSTTDKHTRDKQHQTSITTQATPHQQQHHTKQRQSGSIRPAASERAVRSCRWGRIDRVRGKNTGTQGKGWLTTCSVMSSRHRCGCRKMRGWYRCRPPLEDAHLAWRMTLPNCRVVPYRGREEGAGDTDQRHDTAKFHVTTIVFSECQDCLFGGPRDDDQYSHKSTLQGYIFAMTY